MKIIDSQVSEVTITVRIKAPTLPREAVFSMAASILWVSPIWRDTASANIDARVITPRPPMRIPNMITICPNKDQQEAVLTTVRPVTQTAEVEVKTASTRGAGLPVVVAIGNESSSVMTRMIAANTITTRRAGEVRARWSIDSLTFARLETRRCFAIAPPLSRNISCLDTIPLPLLSVRPGRQDSFRSGNTEKYDFQQGKSVQK